MAGLSNDRGNRGAWLRSKAFRAPAPSLAQFVRQADGQPQTRWMILVRQPNGIDAPERRELNHVVLAGEDPALTLEDPCVRFSSGETVCSQPFFLVVLLLGDS